MPSDSCCLVQVRRCLRHLPCHGRHGAVTVALTNPCGGNNVPRMLCYLIALAIYAHHYSHGHHCRRRRDNEWHLLVAKHFNFKDQLRVGLDSPSREATGPVCVVGGAVDLGDFSQRHCRSGGGRSNWQRSCEDGWMTMGSKTWQEESVSPSDEADDGCERNAKRET